MLFSRVRELLDRTIHNPTYDGHTPPPRPASDTLTSQSSTLGHQYETIDSRMVSTGRVGDGGPSSLAVPPTVISDPLPTEPQPYEIVGVASIDIDPTIYEVSQEYLDRNNK